MDAQTILKLVHSHSDAEESHLLIASVRSYIDGYGSVRVDVTDRGEDGPYRYNASVYDGDTGEFLATGNGGRDVDEALSIVHWQNVKREG